MLLVDVRECLRVGTQRERLDGVPVSGTAESGRYGSRWSTSADDLGATPHLAEREAVCGEGPAKIVAAHGQETRHSPSPAKPTRLEARGTQSSAERDCRSSCKPQEGSGERQQDEAGPTEGAQDEQRSTQSP